MNNIKFMILQHCKFQIIKVLGKTAKSSESTIGCKEKLRFVPMHLTNKQHHGNNKIAADAYINRNHPSAIPTGFWS